jgi:hypothetical protein
VTIQPLVVWLWIGGGVMALGTLLAVFPGRRRNPIDPVSAPVGGRRRRPGDADEEGGADAAGGADGWSGDRGEPVVAGSSSSAGSPAGRPTVRPAEGPEGDR